MLAVFGYIVKQFLEVINGYVGLREELRVSQPRFRGVYDRSRSRNPFHHVPVFSNRSKCARERYAHARAHAQTRPRAHGGQQTVRRTGANKLRPRARRKIEIKGDDMKYEDTEKALKICSEDEHGQCKKCPYLERGCIRKLTANALREIKQLKVDLKEARRAKA